MDQALVAARRRLEAGLAHEVRSVGTNVAERIGEAGHRAPEDALQRPPALGDLPALHLRGLARQREVMDGVGAHVVAGPRGEPPQLLAQQGTVGGPGHEAAPAPFAEGAQEAAAVFEGGGHEGRVERRVGEPSLLHGRGGEHPGGAVHRQPERDLRRSPA